MALLLAIAVLGAVAGVGALLRGPAPVPAQQMTVIRQVVEAINSRDGGSLQSYFTADGVLVSPGFMGRPQEGYVMFPRDEELSEPGVPEGWMGRLDSWGLQAQLGSCRLGAEASINCAVSTRWTRFQVEIGEEWTFHLDGPRVSRLEMMARLDPDPSNRVLPLGLGDLRGWEAWLSETHPQQADGLLVTSQELFLFPTFYFPYRLEDAAEIGASIEEYVESRDPIVGTSVCSEETDPGPRNC
jgi:hypothetical protein